MTAKAEAVADLNKSCHLPSKEDTGAGETSKSRIDMNDAGMICTPLHTHAHTHTHPNQSKQTACFQEVSGTD